MREFVVKSVLAVVVLGLCVIAPTLSFADNMDKEEDYSVSPRFFSKVEDPKTKTVFWLYVKCDYWLGCYTRCEGTLKECVDSADKVGWEIESVYENDRDNSNVISDVHWQKYKK
ncbi:MAG: hypothetical protein COV66_09800 [Nitrospinae bacterium CG11_big_fil_rev_8_21_14_0_20_45_15]|nr:MAG: hypothetical protein COV66_09800 [Nitrospinae bacterium CG11_big_fil_rev_8_21_14_0_20_45_15]